VTVTVTIKFAIKFSILSICWNTRPCYRRWFVSSTVGFMPALKGGAFSSPLRKPENLRLREGLHLVELQDEHVTFWGFQQSRT
jgi:hypothetical protein